MRLSVASLRRVVKGDVRIEFVRQDLTCTVAQLLAPLRATHPACARLRTRAPDLRRLPPARVALLSGPVLRPARGRLKSPLFAGDPLIARFCGLARCRAARTVQQLAQEFHEATLAPLVQLNQQLVTEDR